MADLADMIHRVLGLDPEAANEMANSFFTGVDSAGPDIPIQTNREAGAGKGMPITRELVESVIGMRQGDLPGYDPMGGLNLMDNFIANARRAAQGANPWEAFREGYNPNLSQGDIAADVADERVPDWLRGFVGLAGDVAAPDPFGAVGDVVKGLGVIGVPFLRALTPGGAERLGSTAANRLAYSTGTQYVDPRLLVGAEGNLLRNTPEQQAAFASDIANEGFREAAIVIFDPVTGRFKVGEGNHRLAVAAASGEPLPVRTIKGIVGPDEGMALPRTPQGNRHGYVNSNLPLSEMGFPVMNADQVMEYAAAAGLDADELASLADTLPQVFGDLPPGQLPPGATQ